MGNIVTTFLFDGPVERACSLQKWCHNAEVLRKHLSFQKHVTLRTVVLTNRVQEVSNLCPRAHVRGFDPHLTAAIDRYNRGVPHVHEVTGSCVIRETTQTGCPWSRLRVSLSIYVSI